MPSPSPRPIRQIICIGAVVWLSPFIYLTSLAVLLALFVHGYKLSSHGFLKVYAAPSNSLVKIPALGRMYSTYFQWWIEMAGGDYDPHPELHSSHEQVGQFPSNLTQTNQDISQ